MIGRRSQRTSYLGAWLYVAALAAQGVQSVSAEPGKVGELGPLVLFADLDDDNANAVVDGEERAPPLSRGQAHVLEVGTGFPNLRGEGVRLVRPAGANWRLVGTAAGSAELTLGGNRREVIVLEARAYASHSGERFDLARSHASMTRVLPDALSRDVGGRDEDAFRWMLIGHAAYLPERVDVPSFGEDGRQLDELLGVSIEPVACPSGTAPELECRQTQPLRVVGDAADRNHPEAKHSSLMAEVGGHLLVLVGDQQAARLRVGGPRRTALGPISRLRASLRVHVVRTSPRGAPPIGGNQAGAILAMQGEVSVANGLWGQCGIHFGAPKDLEISVVEPPPPFMLAVGCELGLPASGGTLRVDAGGTAITLQTEPAATPTEVALRLAAQLKQAGLSAVVSVNAKTERGALSTADVLVYDREKKPVPLAPIGSLPLSSDRTLGLCIGEVNIADGIHHFNDHNAVAGTVEERALVKAFDDGDSSTIDVFVIESFTASGRIGESFIRSPRAAIENTVLVDRAGIRAGARSHTLAHELGHILLDMPGHPDDYGVDMPSTLMDADAADATIFGPRRLSVEECERAVRQNGPSAPVPLLADWPLTSSP